MVLEISDTDEINWSTTASVEVEADAKIFGSGVKFKVGVSASVGGAYSTTVTNSKCFCKGSDTVVGHATTYTTPGEP